MKKLVIILFCFSIIMSNAFASNSRSSIKLKAKSCFTLLSKKRDEMLPTDIESAENYLKNKLQRDRETKNIIVEAYAEELSRLSTEVSADYNEVELRNLRISGKKLGIDQMEPRTVDVGTNTIQYIPVSYSSPADDCNLL